MVHEGTLRKIYDLREDPDSVAFIQQATLATTQLGLVPEHGLFGSPEWWRAIEDGVLPVQQVDGYIARVLPSRDGDFEEFEIDAHGERSSWERLASGGTAGSPERIARAEMYEAGRPVRLTYVKQEFRARVPGLPFRKSVLEIWVGNAAENALVAEGVTRRCR